MKLSFGNGNTCELVGANVTSIHANTIASLDDVAAHVVRSFAHPLDYPELASATVPGDTIAIAIDHGTPKVCEILEGTLSALEHAGVEKSAVTILLAAEFADDPLLAEQLRMIAGEEVGFAIHKPDDEEHLALLGVNAAGLPLRLNRLLCDADLVIPIGPQSGSEHHQHSGTLFPQFSDQETIGRFNSPSSYETPGSRKKLAGEIHECDWMLGIGLALRVVPGPDGSVVAIHCGTSAGIEAAAQSTFDNVWQAEALCRADLIVATITGDQSQQTWQNLSRAIVTAENLLESGGAIAICSEIAAKPGPSAKRLRDAQNLADVEKKLLKDSFADSAAALEICRRLQRGTVYLQSRLSSGLVESLGFAPLESDKQLERLVGSYRRCLVLEGAQYLEPKLAAK